MFRYKIKLYFPISRFGFSRITSEKTAEMKHIVMIKLVDLDNSPCNRIVFENCEEGKGDSFQCPHHIIVGLIKIVGEIVRLSRSNEEPEILQKATDTVKLLENHHQEFMKELSAIREEIRTMKLNS